MSTISSKDSENFHGNLDRTESFSLNEMDKGNFIKQLQKKVRLHGQQIFYVIMYQEQVVSLFEHYHKFTFEDVIAHHEFRCEEPDPEIDPDTNLETEESQQLRFESYDENEFDDFGLLRLVVESLLSSELMDKIATKFGNDPEFETYPGQVLFLMALDACNASVQRDVVGAQTMLDSLTLDSYPGGNVTALATEAL